MSIQIQSALDSLKRQSLKVILENVYLSSPRMKDVLSHYIYNGKSVFESLMSFLDFRGATFSSDYMNSGMLLAYMDFYAIYTLTYSNYYVFESLKNISNSKFNHAYNLYKDSFSIVKEKEFSNSYKYIRYCNFSIPKEINIIKSRTNIRGNAVSDILGIDGILTLPVLKSSVISPSSISFNYRDGSVHVIEQNTGENFIYFHILRAHTEKLGMLKVSDPNYITHRYEGENEGVSGYSVDPEFEGTVYGHFSKEIHIKVDSILLEPSSTMINTIWLRGSSNGYDWSDIFSCTPGVMTPIQIERNVLIGLNIRLHDLLGLEVGDRWGVLLNDITLDDPTLELKLGFGALEPVSYVRYNDVSPYQLGIVPGSASLERLKFDPRKVNPFVYDNRISHYLATAGPVSSSAISFVQKDYDITSRNGSLYHKYSFILGEISGVIAEYKQHGGMSLNSIDVEDIGSIAISCNSYTPKPEYIHSLEDPRPSLSFIEYNAYAQNESGRVIIPLLDREVIKKNSISGTFASVKILDNDPTNADLVGLPLDSIIYSKASSRYWRWWHSPVFSKNVLEYYPEFLRYNIGDLIKTTEPEQTWVICEGHVLRLFVGNASDFIPMIFEYVLPDNVTTYDVSSDTGLASYSQRFPVDNTYKLDDHKYMKAYSISTREESSVSYDAESDITLIYNYKLRLGYCIWYPFKINRMIEAVRNDVSSGKWSYAGANIYYMYYIDEDLNVHTAIRTLDKGTNVLKPFTGTLEPSIEMRSLDKPHITPLVFDFALLCV